MHNNEHCLCEPLLCGQHIIKPCQVIALKQVRSQTNTADILFVVMLNGNEDRSFFMTFRDVQPLLDLWDIKPEDIHKIGCMPPEVRERSTRKMREQRKIQRASKKLTDIRNEY